MPVIRVITEVTKPTSFTRVPVVDRFDPRASFKASSMTLSALLDTFVMLMKDWYKKPKLMYKKFTAAIISVVKSINVNVDTKSDLTIPPPGNICKSR
jgi:hypothetical protein